MNLIEMGKAANYAKKSLQMLSTNEKNKVLQVIADGLTHDTEHILSENQKDLKCAKEQNMSDGLIDRLRLTKERIVDMANGLIEIIKLEDPIGTSLDEWDLENKLHIQKIRVPFGVVGIIYESRPNVTVDAFGLCFKTGNVTILKGGKDAIHSNIALTKSIQNSLSICNLDENCIQLITDTSREVTIKFMKLKKYIDVLIPRGGASLIEAVVKNSTIPVIETGTGNCHIYVDSSADFSKAYDIINNAKTQRVGVCNACESLVVHKSILADFLPGLEKQLRQSNVELRADAESMKYLENGILATKEDFEKEYLDYILSIKAVSSLEEAIEHINKYHTSHSDSIITQDEENAEKFLRFIDSACVYVNASTRFTDGYEFGFGAEIGISTQKLHARGPMGLKELTSYKYLIKGNGQIR